MSKSDNEYIIPASGTVPFSNSEYRTVFHTRASDATAPGDFAEPNNDFDFMVII